MTNNDGTMVVTYSSLDQAAIAIDQQGRQLEADLAMIKAKIASVAEVWQGEAKTVYDEEQRKWDMEARNIHDALVAISRAVRDAAPAYKAGDHRAAMNFQ